MVFVSSPASAQVLVTDLTQWVAEPYKSRTYLDLIALAIPSVMREGDGYYTRQAFQLRHVSNEPDRKQEIEVGALLGAPKVVFFQSRGRKRLAMILDLGEPANNAETPAALALFDIDNATEPKLLDFANVSYDRQTGFFDPSKLTLPDGGALLLIASGHSNSNQAYQTYAMIDLHGDRFRVVDAIFLFSDNGCGFERSQRPSFTVAGSAGKPAIQVSVTETVARRNEDCGAQTLPRPGKRDITVTYEWRSQTARFARSSNALDRLAKETSKRF